MTSLTFFSIVALSLKSINPAATAFALSFIIAIFLYTEPAPWQIHIEHHPHSISKVAVMAWHLRHSM